MNRSFSMLIALSLVAALLSFAACESTDRVVAGATCNIQCQDAEVCGITNCYEQCTSLAGDETALAECAGCLQLAAETCDLISGCLSSVCSPNALENWECATFCAAYGQQCDTAYDCMGSCTTWSDTERNLCLECVSLKGYCEAFNGGECAGQCGGGTAE